MAEDAPPIPRYDPIADLVDKLAQWATDANREPWSDDPPGPVATLVLQSQDGRTLADAPLTPAHVRELAWMLQKGVHDNQALRESHERMVRMADVMVAARRAGEDVGELMGAAARKAAEQLYQGAIRLTWGRPGSWEATIVRDWADAGGRVENPERVDQLAELLRAMGEAKDDGGDVISQAMGRAVNELGSLAAFAAGSRWEDQLRNIGGQYADVADGWGSM